ncbi:Fe2+-dependent dioxygenase [Ketobacter sp.]|uniref:Fe2+-dependent dioxygenase n=1 Tax=Ketobacter sp. TaxID=2083498 RepID=UPI000F2A8DC7|nr:Fe2+-dependent dioxygenase [Ketobacter sp.]RLU00617.1 MAG: Fe2+-dependent dioxygenase [Ketobacter sp.]
MLIVIENLLSAEEVTRFRQHLDQAQWEAGSHSAGEVARAVKSNLQLPDEGELAIALGNHLLRALAQHPQFVSAALPKTIYPPKFNRYADGGHYGVHVDSAVMQLPGRRDSLRTDLSATVFLSAPEDYDGGELMIEGQFGAQAVKLNAGDMVLYPSSSLHQVLPVTEGARVCSFFWIQSLVRDDSQRELLYDLDQSIQALRAAGGTPHDEISRLTGIYHNLLRQWVET